MSSDEEKKRIEKEATVAAEAERIYLVEEQKRLRHEEAAEAETNKLVEEAERIKEVEQAETKKLFEEAEKLNKLVEEEVGGKKIVGEEVGDEQSVSLSSASDSESEVEPELELEDSESSNLSAPYSPQTSPSTYFSPAHEEARNTPLPLTPPTDMKSPNCYDLLNDLPSMLTELEELGIHSPVGNTAHYPVEAMRAVTPGKKERTLEDIAFNTPGPIQRSGKKVVGKSKTKTQE